MKDDEPTKPATKRVRKRWLDSVPNSIRSLKHLRRYELMKDEPLIYFLCDGPRLVKIGATRELPQSIATNRRKLGYDGITFDSVYYVTPRRSLLFRTLRAFVRKFNPPANKAVPHVPDKYDREILRDWI